MAEDWASVAAEVEVAIASIGDVSQPDGFPATLKRVVSAPGENSWDIPVETTTYLTVRCIDDSRRIRDINGTLIGETVRTLTVGASVAPLKTDLVAVGVTAGEAADEASTVYHAIDEVRPLSPAGVVLLYEIDLVT